MADLHQKILSGARGIVKLEGNEIVHVTDVNMIATYDNLVFSEVGTPISPVIVPVARRSTRRAEAALSSMKRTAPTSSR